MVSSLMGQERAPYDDFVMDHIRNARNFHLLHDANCESSGANPMCGDTMTLQLRVAGGRVEEAAFQCECCGVSMASASMLTEWVRGRAIGEVGQFARLFVERLAGKAGSVARHTGPMEKALLATVKDFPARARCAALPWATLAAALGESNQSG